MLVNSWGSIWQTTIVWYGMGGNPGIHLVCFSVRLRLWAQALLSPGCIIRIPRLAKHFCIPCNDFEIASQQEVMYLFEILISTYRDGNEIGSIFCCKARLCTGHHLVFCFISDPEMEKAYVSTSWLQQSFPLCHLQRWIKPLLIELIQLASPYFTKKKLPEHTCKKRVMLRRRLFWPKKNCGKSA